MRHSIVPGSVHHHHGLHAITAATGKALHKPEVWVAAGVLLAIVVLIVLTLMYGAPSQPGGWDTFMRMPY